MFSISSHSLGLGLHGFTTNKSSQKDLTFCPQGAYKFRESKVYILFIAISPMPYTVHVTQ